MLDVKNTATTAESQNLHVMWWIKDQLWNQSRWLVIVGAVEMPTKMVFGEFYLVSVEFRWIDAV